MLKSWAPSSLLGQQGKGWEGIVPKGRSVPGQHVPALQSESCLGPGKKNAAGCYTCQASNKLQLGLGLHSSCTLQGGPHSPDIPFCSRNSTLRNL